MSSLKDSDDWGVIYPIEIDDRGCCRGCEANWLLKWGLVLRGDELDSEVKNLVKKSSCGNWDRSVYEMSATSSNGSAEGGGAAAAVKKQPMSPSEFFAKIYGDASASTEHNKSAEETISLQERPQQETKEPSWLYHPHWAAAAAAAASAASHPGLINWSSRPFYNPLQLPPALTALSIY